MFPLSLVLLVVAPGGRTGESGEESLHGGEIELGLERSAIARPMMHSSGSVSLLLSDIPESSESPSVNLPSALVCSGDGGGASDPIEADAPAVSADRSSGSDRTLTASGSGVTGLKCPSNRADGPIPIGDSCQKLATGGTASADLFPVVLTSNLRLCKHPLRSKARHDHRV